MNIQYVINEEGKKVAVQIAIEDWEALWEQLTDDEVPLTEEDWQAIREGKEAIERGEYVTLEELDRELGL
jgi:PHD/YefM family antitoxin component YafN of YafNO toxin-antitoxin module